MNLIEEYALNEPLSSDRIRRLNGHSVYVVCHENMSLNGYYIVMEEYDCLYRVETGYFNISDADLISLDVYRRKPKELLCDNN